MDWLELKKKFQNELKYANGTTNDIDCSLLRFTCDKAGRAIFDSLSKGENPFGLGNEFKLPPIAENVPPIGETVEHYSEYWLCVLGFLARKGHISIANYKLTMARLPSSWAAIYHELKVAEQFFVDQRSYICEACKGSVQICEKILEHFSKSSEWKPPPNFIGSNTIVNNYKVPRSTLQGWQQQDKPVTKKDPVSQEVHYPKSWFKRKYGLWKSKKSVT